MLQKFFQLIGMWTVAFIIACTTIDAIENLKRKYHKWSIKRSYGKPGKPSCTCAYCGFFHESDNNYCEYWNNCSSPRAFCSYGYRKPFNTKEDSQCQNLQSKK